MKHIRSHHELRYVNGFLVNNKIRRCYIILTFILFQETMKKIFNLMFLYCKKAITRSIQFKLNLQYKQYFLKIKLLEFKKNRFKYC